MTADLIEWLRAQLDADEQWAIEASRDPSHPERFVPTGVHWRWLDGETDKEIIPRPEVDQNLVTEDGEAVTAGLVSVETFPGRDELSVHQMPIVASFYIDDMSAAAAGHIARHDPARVLREVAAKKAIIEAALAEGHQYCDDLWYSCGAHDDCTDEGRIGTCDCGRDERVNATLRSLAAVYADRDGYREEWAPDA